MASLVAEIILSFFAVFGMYTAIRILAAIFLFPIDCGMALKIKADTSTEQVKILFLRWGVPPSLFGKRKPVALVCEERKDDEELLSVLRQWEIPYYIVTKSSVKGGEHDPGEE